MESPLSQVRGGSAYPICTPLDQSNEWAMKARPGRAVARGPKSASLRGATGGFGAACHGGRAAPRLGGRRIRLAAVQHVSWLHWGATPRGLVG